MQFNVQEGNINKILDPIVKASNPNLDAVWKVANPNLDAVWKVANPNLDAVWKVANPNLDAVWKVAEIAIQCVEPKAIHRPIMTKVVEELRVAITFQEGNALPFDYSHNMTYGIQNQSRSQMVLLNPR